jgi:succinoglycan biosynthesis transport protein ExoP
MNDVSKGNQESARQLVPFAEAVPALRDPYGRLGLYGASPGDEAEQSGFNLLEYWRILYKRKWLILCIVAAVVVISAVRTLMQTPLYTATVRLQVDNEARVVQTGDITPVSSDRDFMQTQYQLLEGRTMAERVVSALKLGNDSDFLKPKGFSFVGGVMGLLGLVPSSSSGDQRDKIDVERWAVGIVLGNRAVHPVTNSRLIDVSYTDPDPGRAQRIANAYADAFIASNIDKRFQANESAKIFLDDKIKQLKLRLENSERALVAFAQEQQIVAVDITEKSSIAENNLAAANTELGTLITERTKNEELWRQFDRTDAVNLPQVLSSGAISGLRTQRNALEVDYQEKLKTFKPGYPAMVQIKSKIDEIDRQIASEIATIRDSLKAAYESTKVQEEAMKQRVELLRNEFLDLQKRSIQYNILKREVDTNRELYTSLLQRYKEVDVASGAGTNNIFIADKAAPGTPSSESLIRNLLKALGLGLGLGAAAAYGLERLDDKIHSVEQLENITGLSVLGLIPRVRRVDEELADPRSALSEAHRSLCTALQFTTENGLPSTLTITSAGPGEGKSLTATAIAKHFATMGRKVLLVDGDLRNPSQHVKLGCDNSVGLSNCLTGACTPPEAMQRTEIPTLAFIASGPLPPNAADLLAGSRLVSLLSIGREVFDLIIIDGPPVMGLADAQLLSSAVSATLFVVGAGVTRKGLIRGALRRLQLSRGLVIGAALTKYDTKIPGYGYHYGYGYGHHEGYGYGPSAAPRGLSVRDSSGGEQQAQLTHTP